MPSEMAPAVKRLGLTRAGEQGSIPVHKGTAGGFEITLTGTGIGPAMADAAARRMIGPDACDFVIVCGIAGGLAPVTKVGDLVVPAEVYDSVNGERFSSTPFGDVTPAGVIRQGDNADYGMTDDDVARLVGEGVTALDMETAAVARVCQQHGVPWAAFRSISDMAGNASLPTETTELVDEYGKPRALKSLTYLLTHPRQVPLLLRVGKDAAAAARAAADATASAIAQRGVSKPAG